MSSVKLFVCSHKDYPVPVHPLLVPLQVGAALAQRQFPGFTQDSTGENISAKNHAYCELTGQYWAWKNARADYIGFFHYRRYLFPDQAEPLPYRLKGSPDQALLQSLGYDSFQGLIEQYDLIMPRGENMFVSVRRHYADSEAHHEKDLDLALSILLEQHPEYRDAAERYLSGTVHYFCNIFVMRWDVFEDYCRWLFPLLEEFDRRADIAGYSIQEQRVDGYLAERLLGIYYTRNRDRLKTLELPRVHFEPSAGKRAVKTLELGLLPPGSLRRSKIKKLKERLLR